MKKVFYKTITKDSLKSITYKDIKDLDGYLGRAMLEKVKVKKFPIKKKQD
mgnify:CR=1 FL=1